MKYKIPPEDGRSNRPGDWLDCEVWLGTMAVRHSPREGCEVRGWHLYEQCGRHPNGDVRIVVGVASKEEE